MWKEFSSTVSSLILFTRENKILLLLLLDFVITFFSRYYFYLSKAPMMRGWSELYLLLLIAWLMVILMVVFSGSLRSPSIPSSYSPFKKLEVGSSIWKILEWYLLGIISILSTLFPPSLTGFKLRRVIGIWIFSNFPWENLSPQLLR